MRVYKHDEKKYPPIIVDAGKVWLPASPAQMLCAAYDGAEGFQFEGRSYLAAEWFKQEHPEHANALTQIEAEMLSRAAAEDAAEEDT